MSDIEYTHDDYKNDILLDYDYSINRVLTDVEELWYDIHKLYYQTEYETCDWSIRLYFDIDMLYRYKLSLSSISKNIENSYCDCYCVFSPDNIGIIDIYIKTDKILTPVDEAISNKSYA